MTIRVDELLKAQRSVETVLTKNAMKHSKEFIEGMELVRGVESDLQKSKDIVCHTKDVFKLLQQRLVLTSMDIMKRNRKKKRLETCKKILVTIYKRFHSYFRQINELLLRSEYYDALNLIDKALEELGKIPKDSKFDAINDIKRKLKKKRELIAYKTSQGMGDTIAKFDPALYAKCLKTFKVKAGEKSDPRMAGRKQDSKTKILFEVCFISLKLL